MVKHHLDLFGCQLHLYPSSQLINIFLCSWWENKDTGTASVAALRLGPLHSPIQWPRLSGTCIRVSPFLSFSAGNPLHSPPSTLHYSASKFNFQTNCLKHLLFSFRRRHARVLPLCPVTPQVAPDNTVTPPLQRTDTRLFLQH